MIPYNIKELYFTDDKTEVFFKNNINDIAQMSDDELINNKKTNFKIEKLNAIFKKNNIK